jgi:hypothetical protein
MLILVLFSTAYPEEGKGGCLPAVASFFIGPRVGLELNEGKPIETLEWLVFLVGVGKPIIALQALDEGGLMGCCLAVTIGPRVGRQYRTRKVRTMEWLYLLPIPIARLIIAIEAYQGKTMTEIEEAEGLRK